MLKKRWRCNVCETLNDCSRNDCIVCGLKKKSEKSEKIILPNMIAEKRWRCNVCETLNFDSRKNCIVCGLNKEHSEVKETILPKRKNCSFPGCVSESKLNEMYCDYHYHTVCPMCKKNLKEAAQGFCIECGLSIVESRTKKLRIANTVLTVLMVTLSIILTILLILYMFYLN